MRCHLWPALAAALVLGGCYVWVPNAGDAPQAAVEIAFTDELWTAPGKEVDERLTLVSYSPMSGAICVAFGYAEASLTADLDVGVLPIYTASVNIVEGDFPTYYAGHLYRHFDSGWEDAGPYTYHPNDEVRYWEVAPPGVNAVTLSPWGYDVPARLNGLKPCDELDQPSSPTPYDGRIL